MTSTEISETEAPQPSREPEGRFRSRIALVAAIVALVISGSDMVTKCSKQEEDRYSGFRAAVAGEEASWRSLYSDYLDAFGKDGGDAAGKRERFIAVYTLAQQDLPSFQEFDVPPSEKRAAICRLQRMQNSLFNSLLDQGAADPDLERVIQKRSYIVKAPDLPPDEEESRSRILGYVDPFRWGEADRAGTNQLTCAYSTSSNEPGPSPSPVAPAAPATSAGAPSPGAAQGDVPSFITNGSARGWDTTISWCADKAGSGALATNLGRLAGARADSGLVIGPGVRLGRIDLKRISAGEISRDLLPRSVGYGDKAGEQEAADAIVSLFNDSAGQPAFKTVHLTGQTSRWAINVFVCG